MRVGRVFGKSGKDLVRFGLVHDVVELFVNGLLLNGGVEGEG